MSLTELSDDDFDNFFQKLFFRFLLIRNYFLSPDYRGGPGLFNS